MAQNIRVISFRKKEKRLKNKGDIAKVSVHSSRPLGQNFSHGVSHWGWVTHICVSKLTVIGSDNGLSPRWHQAIIWTNAGILLFAPLGTNFNEILIRIQTFSFKKMHLKMSSAKWCPFFLSLNILHYVSKLECSRQVTNYLAAFSFQQLDWSC